MSHLLPTTWAELLFKSLADAGVKDVVVCPGARSTPFALAAVNCGALDIHSSVDERAAGFFALGQARVTGRPSVVLCTSGSAGAHLFPAVVEAAAAGVPLLAMTADRPFELQDCGAAQTMDQLKLFGSHVRRYFEVGMPDVAALHGLRRMAAQAVFLTRYPEPGPVHINVRARKPLEPPLHRTVEDDEEAALAQAIGQRPSVIVEPPLVVASERVLRSGAELIADVARGVIMCGPMPSGDDAFAAAVNGLARATGFPVFAEATSQLRFREGTDAAIVRCEAFERLLQPSSFLRANLPELVLQIGSPPSSLRWEGFIGGQPSLRIIAVTEQRWIDPANMANVMLLGDTTAALNRLTARLTEAGHAVQAETRRFAAAYARANEVAWTAVDEYLQGASSLREGAAVRTVVGALPQRSLLFIGNSLPIRLLDGFVRSGPSALSVLSQRGVNGIDGNIAGALGSALSARRPTTVVLGDLALLHDLNALALAPADLQVPFVIVVLQNYGGRIFEQLPVHARASERELQFILTPHLRSTRPVSALFSTTFLQASNIDELREAVECAHSRAGVTIIEALVPPSGAAADARAIDERVRQRLESTG